MRRSLCFAVLLALACGDDSGNAPGTELGPCVQQQFCESPLQCEGGICVNPDQLGETGSASDSVGTTNPTMGETTNPTTSPETSAATMGETTNPTTGVGETGGTPEIHCTNDGENGCFCGHTPDYGPLGVACSTSTLPQPASCCAGEGWPQYGGCSCWTLSCRQLEPDICYCGLGQPDPEDTPVGSCSPNGMGVCCLDAGFSCTCYADLPQCIEGDVQVGSCSTETIACSEGTTSVGACN